jgi:TolB-like protein
MVSAQEKLSVAVVPFANVSGTESASYLGFQIAEFVSSSMAGYPEVTVIERSSIDKILQEQELELSGFTDEKNAVKVGSIANASQMVVGSFTLDAKGTMSLTGRIVDVNNGTVLGSAIASGPTKPSPNALYRDFVFKLLSSIKSYGMSIAVEARLETLSEEDATMNADYARALEASFRKNDEEARKYLEKVIQSEHVAVLSYMDAARRYQAVVSRLEGASLYSGLVNNMLSHNSALMAQMEPLTIYRNTLKALANKVDAQFTIDAVELTVAQKEQITMSGVSAVITLPLVSLGLKEDALSTIGNIFGQQDIVGLGPSGIAITKKAPEGSLLSSAALDGLFGLSFSASAGYSIIFYDKTGKELWRLAATPKEIARIDSKMARSGNSNKSHISVPVPRDGFALLSDGKVEIQARELKDLAGIRVEFDRDSFSHTAYYASSSDIRWKSLLLHAYRKNYLKIAASDDPCPSIKDLVITDSFYETNDEDLGRIPIVPDDDNRAGFADLWAVVYFGDEISTSVQVAWSGSNTPVHDPDSNSKAEKAIPFSSNSEPFNGPLTARSVLYFAGPTDDGPHDSNKTIVGTGEITVSVKVGRDKIKSTSVTRIMGSKSWIQPNYIDALVLDNGKIFGTPPRGIFCIDAATGKTLWQRNDIKNSTLLVNAGTIFSCGDSGIFSLSITDGKTLWQRNDIASYSLLATDDKIFASGESGTFSLNKATGKTLWKNKQRGLILFFGNQNLCVAEIGSLRIYTLDVFSGETLSCNQVITDGKILGSENKKDFPLTWITGVPYIDGYPVSIDISNEFLRIVPNSRPRITANGLLYSRDGVARDAVTDKTIWSSSLIRNAIFHKNSFLFGKVFCLDLSIINRD